MGLRDSDGNVGQKKEWEKLVIRMLDKQYGN